MPARALTSLVMVAVLGTGIAFGAPARAGLDAPDQPVATGTANLGAGIFEADPEIDEIDALAKWTTMLRRHALQGSDASGCSGSAAECAYENWLVGLLRLAEAPRQEQIVTINSLVNQRRYVSDQEAFGVQDYWATPPEFLTSAGDCEDFAILKYLSLRALGVPAADMRIVVVEDIERRVPHGVLLVRSDEGAPLVLDNRAAAPLSAERVHHYRPYFAVNEDGWWRT